MTPAPFGWQVCNVEHTDIKAAIRGFLSLLEDDDLTVSQAEDRLPRLLDQLALAQAHLNYVHDAREHPAAPGMDYQQLRQRVADRFPNYGYYNTAEHVTTNIGQSGTIVGDAIDDLADIARDLYAVEWCWLNNGEADALWHFEQDFRHHWRRHLRGLQLYLDALELDGDPSA